LFEKNWEKAKVFLNNTQMGAQTGDSLISYLYKKNYSAIALKLVKDKKAQFSLAVDSGNLEIAHKSAQELKD
jgi:coatomer protein complex subunit alpha (xenin)